MTFTRKAVAALGCLLAAAALAACGEATVGTGTTTPKTAAGSDPPAVRSDPPASSSSDPAPSSATATTPGVTKEVADPLERDSYPAPASVKHASAATPTKASEGIVAAGAPSNAEVRKELQQMQAVER